MVGRFVVEEEVVVVVGVVGLEVVTSSFDNSSEGPAPVEPVEFGFDTG